LPPSAPEYEESYYRSREAWPDFRREAESLLSLARVGRESRVLELGCGGGELLERARSSAAFVVGVDLSPEALRLARGERGLPVLLARAERLPFAPASFDAVLAQHLVEHLPNPVEALREWRRVLRPGGMLALVTPNAAYPDPGHFHDDTHATLFTAATLRSALEETGFRVSYLFALFPYLGHSRPARSASIRLAGLARLPLLAGQSRSLVAAAVRTSEEHRGA
jgi:SAM-dependent methyltransferase